MQRSVGSLRPWRRLTTIPVKTAPYGPSAHLHATRSLTMDCIQREVLMEAARAEAAQRSSIMDVCDPSGAAPPLSQEIGHMESPEADAAYRAKVSRTIDDFFARLPTPEDPMAAALAATVEEERENAAAEMLKEAVREAYRRKIDAKLAEKARIERAMERRFPAPPQEGTPQTREKTEPPPPGPAAAARGADGSLSAEEAAAMRRELEATKARLRELEQRLGEILMLSTPPPRAALRVVAASSNLLFGRSSWSAGGGLAGSSWSAGAVVEPRRFWSKPKKRPKVGTGFHEKAQKWRDEYLLDRHRVLADSLRAYVDFSATRRVEPWDTRFAPFDRVEKDGVHIITRYLMEDKLQLCGYHHRPVKRLCCNVGLMGPQITTKARWKPSRFATLPANTTKMERMYQRDKNVSTGYHHD